MKKPYQPLPFSSPPTLSGSNWSRTLPLPDDDAETTVLDIELAGDKLAEPPEFRLVWRIPQIDIYYRWYPSLKPDPLLPPDWDGKISFGFTDFAPLLALYGANGENRLTFALSDAQAEVTVKAGVVEETMEIECSLTVRPTIFHSNGSYRAALRLDRRPLAISDAIREAAAWMADNYPVRPAVPDAFRPVYSTWYSYHQNIDAAALEAEAAAAREYGLSTLIVDDGWQTDDNRRGYAFCGDWEPSGRRFPDLRRHVDNIHALGMKFLLWYGLPLVGVNGKAFSRFKGKFLFAQPHGDTYILDPRFPEVREYLTGLLEQAIIKWDLDGFKLDFIDSFALPPGQSDPAAGAGARAGRDYAAIAPAVEALLDEIGMRCRAHKPGLLIEFRQKYVGPAIRRHADIVRAADCPGDARSNRIRTLELRLCCPNAAVHSDMISWNYDESPASAARQLLNVIFSVPQLSVCLDQLPLSHRTMLRFWMRFLASHRDVLLHGHLTPLHPELNYPVVYADNTGATIVAVYAEDMVVELTGAPGKYFAVINVSGNDQVAIKLKNGLSSGRRFSACGDDAGEIENLREGLVMVSIPVSGLLEGIW